MASTKHRAKKATGIRKGRTSGPRKSSGTRKPKPQQLAKVVQRRNWIGKSLKRVDANKIESSIPDRRRVFSASRSSPVPNLAKEEAENVSLADETSGDVPEQDAYNSLLRNCRTNFASPRLCSLGESERIERDTPPQKLSNRRNDSAELIIGYQNGAADQLDTADGDKDHYSSSKDFSGEAAARENAHINREISKESAAMMHGDVFARSRSYVIAGLGKVVITLASFEMVEELRKTLESVKSETMHVNALGLQSSMLSRWHAADKSRSKISLQEKLSLLESAATVCLRNYLDLLLCYRLAPEEESRMRKLVVAHCLSHATRARSRVLRHDELKRKEDSMFLRSSDRFRDQGFTRARILFLTPMRNDAYEIVSLISKLAVGTSEGEQDIAQVANRDRFEEEFGPGNGFDFDARPDESVSSKEGTFASQPLGDWQRHDECKSRKEAVRPRDWQYRFRGNTDDDFKIGIALAKKSLKLYSDFYSSDIIVASPLGIVRSLEAMSSQKNRKAGTKNESGNRAGSLSDEWKSGLSDFATSSRRNRTIVDDDGFLSSIEICVIDGANVFGMQNWSTLLQALGRVNNLPSSPRETDFERVRKWALDEMMRYFRQTIILSAHRKAEVMSLFRSLRNHSGRVALLEVPSKYGSIADVTLPIHHRFLRVADVSTPQESPEKRFQFFKLKVLPEVRYIADCQVLVVVPGYFDFVRVRNMFVELESDDPCFQFSCVSEYSSAGEVARARTSFFNGKIKLLAMTERLHFYWRNRIRGANTILWYALPEHAHFYPEIVSFTSEAAENQHPVQSIVLYDMFDEFALERIVGSTRCKEMTCPDSRSMYLFA